MLLALASLLFSGLVQAAISPPLNLVWLHPVAWVPALAVFARLRGRRAFAAGWLVGTSANLAIYAWLPGTVQRFGGLPYAAAIAVWLLFAAGTGLYAGVFAWGFAPVRRAAGAAWPFAVAAWFCALEFLWPQVFGYLQGHAWYQVPRLFLVSATTGVSGVSFLVLACNAVLLQGLEAARGEGGHARAALRRNPAVLAALVGMAVAISSARLAAIEAAEGTAPVLRVALVQPDRTIERTSELYRMKPTAFAEDLVALSREAASQVHDGRRIDVYVWPEGALRSDPRYARNAPALDFVRETGAEVWTGANHDEIRGGRIVASHNSAYRIFGSGEIDRRYDKNILVPFGEYVPMKAWIPFADRIPTAADFEPGTEVPRYEAGPARFIFLICYEAIRSGFVRRSLGPDTNLLVNVTVDSWYGDSAEQSQHLMLAASQAALNGLPLVRATTTGISAFADARGLLTGETGKFTREALVRDVRLVRVPGAWSRWGDWFAWGSVASSAALLLAARRRH